MAKNYSDIVQPLIPDCAAGRLNNKFNNDSALEFDPTVWDYYRVRDV